MESPHHPSSTHALWPSDGSVPLSVAIVCKDARCTIARTIRSVQGVAREVIVLDSGSTDGTLSILHRLGVTVHHQNWLGYIAQKNCALNMCSQPWVLCLDSDESLEPELRDAVLSALRTNDPTIAGYEMNRKVWYQHRYLDHAWQPEWRLRLVRRGVAEWTGYDPHDSLELKPRVTTSPEPGSTGILPTRVVRLGGVMRHDSIESIAVFLAKQCKHGQTAAAALHKRGRKGRVRDLLFSPVNAWLKQMVARSAWRDGWRGWLAATAAAIATASKHAALIELSRAGKDAPPTHEASRSAAAPCGTDDPNHSTGWGKR